MRRFTALLPILALVLAFSSCTGGGRTLVAEFTDVGDLVGRANVQQSDAVVGRISSIQLIQRKDEWLAKVTMHLGPEAHVPAGTKAVVRSTSLLGEKYVDLVAPPGSASAPELPSGAVIASSQTAKAPELEQVFDQLGAILASGGLTDLGRITSASAMILEGQEDDVGRVLDGTAKLVAAIRTQREALASALSDLNEAAKTLDANRSMIDSALSIQPAALSIVASQQQQLDTLITELDKLGKPLAQLTRGHESDLDSQVRSLRTIVPQLYAVRGTLDRAVKELPPFTKLFARAAPGDYVQLDILIQALPVPLALPAADGTASSAKLTVRNVFVEAMS
jgi:phospholipid/cholesterol/gamma-HCH transport system substrate-binding protein